MATAQEQLKPKQNNARPKFDHPFQKLCGLKTAIVIQQRGGNVIKGRAKWFRNGFLKLTDAQVIGLNRQVSTEWLLVDHQTIAHIHPDPDAPNSGGENGAT